MNKQQARRHRAKEPKYRRYRDRVGKPNGPGQPGNKAGKNHTVVRP